jgi:hypothetical protein
MSSDRTHRVRNGTREHINGPWAYIRPDAPTCDDPAEHAPDRPEDCMGVCCECGNPAPLGHMMCRACGLDD